MLKILFLPLFFSCLFNVAEAQATEDFKQNSGDVKVGFVNIRELISDAPQVEVMRQKLSKEFEENNKEIFALRQMIAKLNLSSEKKPPKKKLSQLQAMISEKQLELMKLQQNLKDAYSLRRNEELGRLQLLIVETVAAVSKEKSLDIVLNNTGVVYINGRVDITKIVFERLEKQVNLAD